ncbi:MAG: polyprenyl synthetase family protein [Casimicrobiaceae bacterium]|nr:polyprenyl synthetase family protein [Casimicrobiaceae bacterium]MCX8097823.1 polyprenyl synthetase family protein [Casimicrobiaceae bacterium]
MTAIDTATGAAQNQLEPLSAIAKHLERPLRQLDAQLQAALASDVPLVNTIAHYIANAGGKRIRPILVFLGCEVFEGSASSPAAVQLAAIVELIHTATLLHDDVVDQSDLRRGRPTANAEFGNPASVLVGDFLYSRAFQLMVALGKPEVLEVLANATNRIAEGEVMQLMALGRLDLSVAEYLRVIEAKTAKLFEAAGALGAIAAGAEPALVQKMADYARHLGVAFQIADDVLDYRGHAQRLGKRLGDDLAEGKLTLPIIMAFERSDPTTTEQLKRVLTHNREHADEHDASELAHVYAVLESCGAFNASLAVAHAEAECARTIARSLPGASAAKHWMLELASYAVSRDR